MESSVELGFLRTTEKAAIEAARTMGYGNRKYSDQVAVEAMREEMGRLKMRGTIVIGEGERDKAPMLYVGEAVGGDDESYPEIGPTANLDRAPIGFLWQRDLLTPEDSKATAAR